MVDPSSAPLLGLMDTSRPVAVSRHHMSIDLNSTKADCQFSIRCNPNFSEILETYVESSEGSDNTFEMAQTFTPENGHLVGGYIGGPSSDILCSWLNVPENVSIAETPILDYGQCLDSDAFNTILRFCDGYYDKDRATTLLATNGSQFTSDGYGVFEIGRSIQSGETFSVSLGAKFNFLENAAVPATTGNLTIQFSPDRVNFAQIGTDVTAASNATENYTVPARVAPVGSRYWRVVKRTNGTSSGANPRSLASVTLAMEVIDSAANLNTYVTHPLPSYGPASQLCQASALVGMTLLVSNMASTLDDGGELAAVVRSASTLPPGGTTTFSELSQLPSSYTGPVRTGAFGIWTGAQEEDYFYRPLDFIREESNVIEVSGTFASAAGNVRVEVWLIMAAFTEEPLLAPQVHPYIQQYFDSALTVLSSQPRLVCENPLHPKFVGALKKIGGGLLSAVKTAAPYLLKQVPVVGDIMSGVASAAIKNR